MRHDAHDQTNPEEVAAAQTDTSVNPTAAEYSSLGDAAVSTARCRPGMARSGGRAGELECSSQAIAQAPLDFAAIVALNGKHQPSPGG